MRFDRDPAISEQFYTALKVNGCEVEMLRLPNSSHGGSVVEPPIARKTQNQAMVAWMDRHILGKEKTFSESEQDDSE